MRDEQDWLSILAIITTMAACFLLVAVAAGIGFGHSLAIAGGVGFMIFLVYYITDPNHRI